MGSHAFVTPEGDPFQGVPLVRLTGLIASLTSLPDGDLEIADISVMVHAALEVALGTNASDVLGDALRFAQGRLAVRGSLDVGLAELATAVLVSRI